MRLESILLILAAYMLGSIPTAYLLGRRYGVDMRRYGSRNVGGSNAATLLGTWAFFAVGLVDAGKAALPTFLALYLNLGLEMAVLAGLSAIVGHDWSLYLGFTGGRGIGPTLGMMFVLFPWGCVLILGVSLAGKLVNRDALACLLSLLVLPLIVGAAGQPPALVAGCLGILLIAAIKRLLANGEPIPPERRGQILRNRLLHDRDVGPDEPWTECRAGNGTPR